nr:C2 calcium/lipid-binding domain, CaLB [Tanacetum cinerariifolium]
MNRGFLDSRGRNKNHTKKKNADASTGLFTESDRTRNDANLLMKVELPSVMAMEVKSPLVYQTNAMKLGGESYPPLPNHGTTSAGNIPDKSSYAKDDLNSMLENGLWFIHNHLLILRKWNPDVDLLKEDVGNMPDRPSYDRLRIELQADVELKDSIVVVIPKIIKEGCDSELASIPCDPKEEDDSDNGDLDIYEPRACYDENNRIYAEAVTFVIKKLVSYKKQFAEFMEIKKQWIKRRSDDDMEYDSSNVEFAKWLASKFYNHKTMDQYTKSALQIYWTRGDDEVELTNEESFDPDDENLIEGNEVANI